jgi:uncharacterized protein (TIGR00369 family)
MADIEFPSPELKKQPNSLHCFACGLENSFGLQIRFYDNGEDEVVAKYVVPDHYQGYPGIVHGGITATILDELVGRAVLADRQNKFMVSAKLNIRYRKPVPLGEPLDLMGKVTRRRGRIATSRAEIRLQDGSIAAEAEATLVRLDQFDSQVEDLERLGWRIYPDSPVKGVKGGEDDSA